VSTKHVFISGAAGALGHGVTGALGGYTLHTPTIGELDLTDEAAVSAYFAKLPELWGSVHLAGGFAMKPVADTTLDDLRAMHRLNFETAFLCCREAVKRGAKRIVNVAARTVLVPTGGMVSYATSKAAVAALTVALAAELPGILVNAVAPSIIDTPANRRAMPGADHASWPKPDEIAQAIRFLISEENTLTSGTVVPVFGRA
jgi:NAD(P)-dependent dehydrogenase (short-subunit alcohol dehydrogenase family)